MRWLARVSIAFAIMVAAAACSSTPAASNSTPIDAAPDPCLPCGSGQICVARYNGTCGVSVECVTRTIDCAVGTCSPACETAYCPQPYQCRNRPPCGGESPNAFTCYGP